MTGNHVTKPPRYEQNTISKNTIKYTTQNSKIGNKKKETSQENMISKNRRSYSAKPMINKSKTTERQHRQNRTKALPNTLKVLLPP